MQAMGNTIWAGNPWAGNVACVKFLSGPRKDVTICDSHWELSALGQDPVMPAYGI